MATTHRNGEPTVAEAQAALLAAQRIATRSERAALDKGSQSPLVAWGLHWLCTYLSLQFLPFTITIAVIVIGGVLAYLFSWRHDMQHQVRNGWETQVTGAWWITMIGTCVVVIITMPEGINFSILIGATIWSLALGQYAVITRNRPLLVLSLLLLIGAPVIRFAALDWVPLFLALVGGGGMVLVGVSQQRQGWR